MESIQNFNKFISQLSENFSFADSVYDKFKFLIYDSYGSAEINDNFIVFEDWWIRKPDIVKSKLYSILGISKKIHGRKCIIAKINKTDAESFLIKNHILGSVNSKVKLGLFYNEELVSVATFAGQRQFRNGIRSVELLRFCHKNKFSVTGGLDKLLKAYTKDYHADEIMTYIDLDWGNGNAFEKIGFKRTEIKKPMNFFVNKYSGERIPEKYFTEIENIDNFVKVKNSGSLKLVKKIN